MHSSRAKKRRPFEKKRKENPTVDIGMLEKWTQLLISRAMKKVKTHLHRKTAGGCQN